ncbi:hypothetical protein Cgig2_024669 [Carnegiea gigantea]|uniref:DUF4283 domain-containing protein n=1 Tax=Carnegiea gigantea TaxID=171969 RepID=A0A9Q1K8Z8_9CARY|nr:hypothetical protein Cgig2_024669 [Carnegiea gigantea]
MLRRETFRISYAWIRFGGHTHPPKIFRGFIQRIWGDLVDEAISIDQGAILIQFNSENDLQSAMSTDPILFDRRPCLLPISGSPLRVPHVACPLRVPHVACLDTKNQCRTKKGTTAIWARKEAPSQPQKESSSSEPRLETQQTEAQKAYVTAFITPRQHTMQASNLSMSAQFIHAYVRHQTWLRLFDEIMSFSVGMRLGMGLVEKEAEE